MTEIVAQWFGVIGFDTTPPETLAELIPYLLHVFVAVGITVYILWTFRTIVMALITRKPRL